MLAVNLATYRAVIRLETALPGYLKQELIEEPMIVEDPIGRIAPVHLQFITSWDAFNSMLERRFHNRHGYLKMKQREYALQIRSTAKDVEQSQLWQCAFSPWQRVEMSFTFSQDCASDGNNSNTTFPGCQTPSGCSKNADIQCKKCGMWFRRIIVVHDDEPELQSVPPQKSRHARGPTLLREDYVTSNRKGAYENLSEQEREDLTSFKRVRLVSKRRRTGFVSQAGIYETFGREWALSLVYVEGKDHRCGRAVEYFLQKNAQSGEPTLSEAEYKSVMDDLVHALLLHNKLLSKRR